ncbi:MAG: hypothetical protein ACXIUB_06735 [Wenzhouxiangella sp.]
MMRALVAMICMVILSGCLYSKFDVDVDELELLPPDAAAAYLNSNQINRWCTWDSESAYAPDYGSMPYDKYTAKYTVVNQLNGDFEVYVVFFTGRFVGTMCPIAHPGHGRLNGYVAWHYTSRDRVINIITALESLGIQSGRGQASVN